MSPGNNTRCYTLVHGFCFLNSSRHKKHLKWSRNHVLRYSASIKLPPYIHSHWLAYGETMTMMTPYDVICGKKLSSCSKSSIHLPMQYYVHTLVGPSLKWSANVGGWGLPKWGTVREISSGLPVYCALISLHWWPMVRGRRHGLPFNWGQEEVGHSCQCELANAA